MMERFSARRHPQGNFDQMRLLDAHLSLESMLVRETVQNSWDAKDPRRGAEPVEWRLDVAALAGPRAQLLKDLLADVPEAGLPPEAAPGRTLASVLSDDVIATLVVGDRNTVGLTGPARSDDTSVPPSERRFARFLLDMGRPPKLEVGGGTYGYGKTVLWRSSECATVLVYSRFREGKAVASRLMGAALGDPFDEGGSPMTGRTWWGRRDPDANVLPIEGVEADQIAADLGLWDADDPRTGTSVLVVGSRFATLNDALRLREAARWHCWPKWSAVERLPDMRFLMSHNEEPLEPLDTSTDPMIEPFARALERAIIRGGDPCQVRSPRITTGHLAVEYATRRSETSPVDEDDDVRPIRPPLNHVALVRRGPRLHIRFMEFPTPPPDGMMRAGVFLTGEKDGQYSPEEAFASAEPPTHDDWSWRSLTGTNKTIVKVGLQRMTELMRGEAGQKTSKGRGQALARLSNHLGNMLDQGSGPSAPRPRTSGGGTRKATIKIKERDLLHGIDETGQVFAVLPFDVLGRGSQPVNLSPSVRVVNGDGKSRSADELAESLSWNHEERGIELTAPTLQLGPEDPAAGWSLWVPVIEPRRLRVSVRAEVTDG